jgi:hypothetical protein
VPRRIGTRLARVLERRPEPGCRSRTFYLGRR